VAKIAEKATSKSAKKLEAIGFGRIRIDWWM
jgi:hypothetical protein